MQQNETGISRLTFNTNGWQYPSGFYGKSKTTSYEKSNGYGHEEWLFDFTKLIDGYHYGFLQPINKYFQKYCGNIYSFFLYTMNSKTNEKLWVGKLNNVEVIDKKISEKVKAIYVRKGWYEDMKEDLQKLGLKKDSLDQWPGLDLFNVRFIPDDFEKFPDKTLVSEDDKSISSYYYTLLHLKNEPKIAKNNDGKFILGRYNPTRRFLGKSIIKKFEEKLIEFPLLHHQISIALEQTLKKEFDEVYAEHQTGFNTSVDLVAVKGKKNFFYEIKTYNDSRTCIRQAIGQLLEYSYFPNQKLADEIFIVTPHKITNKNTIDYLKNLRENIGLPIRYMCYDLEQKKILQTI
jgi:hypothetical protein